MTMTIAPNGAAIFDAVMEFDGDDVDEIVTAIDEMIQKPTPAYVAGYPLAEIVAGYVECALWAGLDYSDTTDHGGEPRPLDENYGAEDIAPDAMTLIEADVLTFARRAWHVANAAGWDAGQFGHDYFLTRNGHGAGFWDRGRSVGDHLSSMARSMGEMDLYVGDDGKVYA